MHKRQEMGNLFMKSNPKPARKPINLSEQAEPLPLPPPQRKQVNLQDPFDLKNPKIKDNNGDQPFTSRINMGQSLDYDERYLEGNNIKNYNPSFFNNSLNVFPNNDNHNNNNKRPNNLNNSYNNFNTNSNNNSNNKVDWINFDDTIKEDIKDDIKLTQSQRLLQINHPMKKFYKNPKFNFSEKPVETTVVETRARVN